MTFLDRLKSGFSFLLYLIYKVLAGIERVKEAMDEKISFLIGEDEESTKKTVKSIITPKKVSSKHDPYGVNSSRAARPINIGNMSITSNATDSNEVADVVMRRFSAELGYR